MALQGVLKGACGHLPQYYSVTGTVTRQDPSIGTERQAADTACDACEQRHGFVGLCVIQPDAYTASNCQESAVRRILYGFYRTPTQTGLRPDRKELGQRFPGHTGRRHGQEQQQACGQGPDPNLHCQHRAASSMASPKLTRCINQDIRMPVRALQASGWCRRTFSDRETFQLMRFTMGVGPKHQIGRHSTIVTRFWK